MDADEAAKRIQQLKDEYDRADKDRQAEMREAARKAGEAAARREREQNK